MNRNISIIGDKVYLQFHDPLAYEHEHAMYRDYPWATPKLLAANPSQLLLTVERGDRITKPTDEDVDQLAYLLNELALEGVHHRDVHPANIVKCGDEVKLIDWETAILAPSRYSYDLQGPIDVPVPVLHGGLLPQWWMSNDPGSVKNVWGRGIPEWVYAEAD